MLAYFPVHKKTKGFNIIGNQPLKGNSGIIGESTPTETEGQTSKRSAATQFSSP